MFKKVFWLLLIVLISASVFSFTAYSAGKTAEDFGGKSVLILHYHRYDGNYDGWNLWIWPHKPESLAGKSYEFDHEDDFGPFAIITFDEKWEELGFIVRLGEWEKKDVNADRFVKIPENGIAEIWVLEGEMDFYIDPDEVDLSPRIKAAFLDNFTEIYAYLSTPFNTKEWKEKVQVAVDGQRYPIKSVTKADPTDISTTKYIKISLSKALLPEDISKLIQLNIDGYVERIVICRKVLDDDAFYYSDELGAIYKRNGTEFRIWSPVSSSAYLLLYNDYNESKPAEIIPMAKNSKGVWTVTVSGDLHLKAYKYRFISYGKIRETVDMFSKAVTKNGQKSVVVDLSRTNFSGWEEDIRPSLNAYEDSIIYEIHVADITGDPSTTIINKGKYLGLTERGASNSLGVKVGLDHLVELGITHVHIMPIQDSYYFREGEEDQYGWGYDPYLYWVPEGHYSTDPSNPLSRIIEVKKMVKALHDSGIRVILDVVYNHTAQTGPNSPFDQTVPTYFYRTDHTGAYTNGSGVGNEIATERPMMRKFIVDSLLYWIREYHVDGFRFDLLGLFDEATVNAIESAIHAEDPTILIYGEPWGGWGANITFGKGDQKGMHIALFNDGIRDAVIGSVFNKKLKGFALGSRAKETRIKRGIVGSISFDSKIYDFTSDPEETINYVSSHDNLTLWDKNAEVVGHENVELLKKAQKLSNAIILLSQGIPFLHGGVDFCRTKYGNDNSYNAGLEINMFDWKRKAEFYDVFSYYKGLIELRKTHNAFRMRTADSIKENLVFLNTPQKRMVAYRINGEAVGDPWKDIIVIFNGNSTPVFFNLPEGDWNVVVNAEKSGTEILKTAGGVISIAGTSACVLYK
ncbi:pullulanase [Kosmotoga arenicorallina S304]|uniref:pullulanase n=1 Tax=Kosmotoga arenicorallina S304 TaxID=1453497 RepID=A0A176K1Z4_9BACT|nr:type I pullulanase [Kosmotoga arenicorallina]OAA31194.1 pullulanase [Kosmotoga arenicorallina S304]